MTTACNIRNPSSEAATLPYPLRGSLKPGQTICLAETKASLITLCPGIDTAFKLTSLETSGPFDSTYGPTADDVATTGAAGLESATDKTNLDVLVAYLTTGVKANILRRLRGFIGVNAQTGTTYTAVLTDAGKLITMANASGIALTIPPEASVAWEAGDEIEVMQIGAGAITLTAGAAVTITAPTGKTLVTSANGDRVRLVKLATTNLWRVTGDLVAS